ncbi:AbrB/MazE/SpoVT family DNA-binding domain-containing protein [Candidatus Gracilibacteria bacterium]|nr:AbrB/MazE/SpoVT family DNA-binding domain-containing protein [Candidatus Gracilibacteria bacterium]
MTRNKVGSENVRKITRVGSMSYSITIPVEYMRKLKWREKQKVVVTKRGKKLVIEDWEA